MMLNEELLKSAVELFIVIQYMVEEEGVKLELTDEAREKARVKIRELGWENLKLQDFLE